MTDREGLKVLDRHDGSVAHTFRYGDSSEGSPSISGGLVIWGDFQGYVRAIGPSTDDEHLSGQGDWSFPYVVMLALAMANVVFFMVILIILRRMRKRYMRRVELEFEGDKGRP
jgi:hypothetical protein